MNMGFEITVDDVKNACDIKDDDQAQYLYEELNLDLVEVAALSSIDDDLLAQLDLAYKEIKEQVEALQSD